MRSLGLLLLMFGLSVLAAPPPQSAVCVACHGPAGKSPNPEWPHLAGQNQAYLAKAVRAYRLGERNDALMSPIAKSLTESDIDLLAEYYSRLKPAP